MTYRSGDDELQLRYDLWHTEPLDRRINGQVYQAPALASPLAVQGSSGVLTLAGATLRTEARPVWLIAQTLDPAERVWVAVNPEASPTWLRLETPGGVVSIERFGLGRLAWRQPASGPAEIVIETLDELVGLTAPAGVTVHRRDP